MAGTTATSTRDQWAVGTQLVLDVTAVLLDARSDFQRIEVLDTRDVGRLLVLDGNFQTSEVCEKGYHEMIVHVALCRSGGAAAAAVGQPGKSVLVIGGGDGGAAREALKHSDVGRVDMVEIDAAVVAAAREHLPAIWGGNDSDERFHLHFEDALEFLRRSAESPESPESADAGISSVPALFDLCVIDGSDPVGPGTALYTDEFYRLVAARLKPTGAVTVQAGSAYYLPEVTQTVLAGLRKVMRGRVEAFECFTRIYPGGVWNLVIGTMSEDDDPAEVDKDRAQKQTHCDFYSEETHRAAFALPPIARRILSRPPPPLEAVEAIVAKLE
jgi:spermidine synthase